ncbi:MAG: RNA pyrophosphohydrolase [Campylobacteraceae bacterium]
MVNEKVKVHDKVYRPNVAAIILSPDYPFKCNVFIGQRKDIKDAWQFPQGGIDKGENADDALFRELKEEIGTKKIEVVARYSGWLYYDFPNKKLAKMSYYENDEKKFYDGQIQKYYLVRLKNKAKIDLDTKDAEFIDYKFIRIEEVLDYITHFKKPVYKQVLDYFKRKGYL